MNHTYICIRVTYIYIYISYIVIFMRFQICNLYNTQLAPVVEASRYPPRKSESSQRTTGVEALWAQKKVATKSCTQTRRNSMILRLYSSNHWSGIKANNYNPRDDTGNRLRSNGPCNPAEVDDIAYTKMPLNIDVSSSQVKNLLVPESVQQTILSPEGQKYRPHEGIRDIP